MWQNRTNLLYFAWAVALVGVVGSLYFSEVAGLVPCVLCWWQRILLYPLLVILTVGILKKENNLPLYVLPFAIIGMAVALYHYLLQMGVIPEEAGPCTAGVSCVERQWELMGFITIPLMAFVAFTALTTAMIFYKRKENV